jgi:hypothetical protein
MEHKYSTMKTFFVHHQSKKHLTQKKPFLIAIEQKYSTPKTIIIDHHQAKKNQPKNSFPSTSKHKYSAPKNHFQSPLGHNYPSTKPYGGERTVATCKHGRSVNLVTRGRGNGDR